MNRREFVGSILLGIPSSEMKDVGTTCSVCGKRGFTAEQSDVLEQQYGKYMGGTCCYDSSEEELYIHPQWLK